MWDAEFVTHKYASCTFVRFFLFLCLLVSNKQLLSSTVSSIQTYKNNINKHLVLSYILPSQYVTTFSKTLKVWLNEPMKCWKKLKPSAEARLSLLCTQSFARLDSLSPSSWPSRMESHCVESLLSLNVYSRCPAVWCIMPQNIHCHCTLIKERTATCWILTAASDFCILQGRRFHHLSCPEYSRDHVPVTNNTQPSYFVNCSGFQ